MWPVSSVCEERTEKGSFWSRSPFGWPSKADSAESDHERLGLLDGYAPRVPEDCP